MWTQKTLKGTGLQANTLANTAMSGTEHIWTPKALTAYLPQMLARPLALPCQTQTLSEALEAKGLASIEQQ